MRKLSEVLLNDYGFVLETVNAAKALLDESDCNGKESEILLPTVVTLLVQKHVTFVQDEQPLALSRAQTFPPARH